MITGLVQANNALATEEATCHSGWGMMGPGMMGFGATGGWFFSFFWLVSWLVGILVLIALFRWLWLRGDKENRKEK